MTEAVEAIITYVPQFLKKKDRTVIWIRRKIFDRKIAEKISQKIEELERKIERSELEILHEHTEDELESKREKVEANPSEEEQKVETLTAWSSRGQNKQRNDTQNLRQIIINGQRGTSQKSGVGR